MLSINIIKSFVSYVVLGAGQECLEIEVLKPVVAVVFTVSRHGGGKYVWA